jgi:hypothetical protein
MSKKVGKGRGKKRKKKFRRASRVVYRFFFGAPSKNRWVGVQLLCTE